MYTFFTPEKRLVFYIFSFLNLFNGFLRFIFFFLLYPKTYICQTENPTLLNYCSLDNGFYTVCNIVPNCKYFSGLNIPLDDIKNEQQKYAAQGKTDFIVTRGKKYYFEKYTCIAVADAEYKGGKRTYYLYERKSLQVK